MKAEPCQLFNVWLKINGHYLEIGSDLFLYYLNSVIYFLDLQKLYIFLTLQLLIAHLNAVYMMLIICWMLEINFEVETSVKIRFLFSDDKLWFFPVDLKYGSGIGKHKSLGFFLQIFVVMRVLGLNKRRSDINADFSVGDNKLFIWTSLG